MKTIKYSLSILALPTLANAHPGHLVGLGGHDHWVAGIAIAGAAGAALWGAFKGRKKNETAEPKSAPAPKGEVQQA